MRSPRAFVATVAALLAALGLTPAAGATEATFQDPSNDVTGQTSGAAATEPRVDITAVHVDHQTRRLEVRVTVAQITPLDSPVWSSGQLNVSVALSEEGGSNVDAVDFLWSFLPDGAGGAAGDLSSLSGGDYFSCPTLATVDEVASQYVFTAGPDCLTTVPRAIAVRATASFNSRPDDFEFFDYARDNAPDSRWSSIVATGGSATITRVAGQDRIETAIAISADRFGDGGASAAVLASSGNYPDAIAGAPLATANSGPILLTGTDGLDPRVEIELVRILPPGSDVYLLGGTGALSPAVASEVTKAGFHVRRIAGANRFDTAAAVADALPSHALVVIADGRGFREALVGSSAAAALGGVVVLTDGTSLPPATDDYLAHDATRHLAIGAAAVAAPGAERITASSVSELSVKVLERLQPNVRIIGIASTGSFADALAAAPHLAALHGALLLTDGTTLSAPTAAKLTDRRDELREVLLVGGTGTISPAVADQIRAALSS